MKNELQPDGDRIEPREPLFSSSEFEQFELQLERDLETLIKQYETWIVPNFLRIKNRVTRRK